MRTALAIAVGLIAMIAPQYVQAEDEFGEDDTGAVVASNNAFAANLYQKLAAAEGNIFFSPSSIHTALTMTSAGARGRTLWQMQVVLSWPIEHRMRPYQSPPPPNIGAGARPPESIRWEPQRLHTAYETLLAQLSPGKGAKYQLAVANALWGQKGEKWLSEFLKTTRDNYGAGLREVDFSGATEAARKTINDWVEKQTQDKIKELLHKGDIDPMTALVLTNAIYFKGDWASQFKKDRTRDGEFTVAAGKKVTVPMMHQAGEFEHADAGGAQVLKLPYAGGELSMVIVLPKAADGLAAMEKTLSADTLSGWLEKLRKQRVDVTMPRFRLDTRYELVKPLKDMGMTDAFGGGADFSGMNGKKDLFISKVIHQAFVDVNEEGTEAAAATAVVMTKSAPPRAVLFRADHPFLFLIRHEKTGAILFLGRVVNPTA